MITLCIWVIATTFGVLGSCIAGLIRLISGVSIMATTKKVNITEREGYKRCKEQLEQKRKQELRESIKEEDSYIYSQLDAWSFEFELDSYTIKESKRKLRLPTTSQQTREKLNKTIVQAQKRLANNEKNIRVTCKKYGLNANDYLGNSWET